jgi:hypothetical protein
MGLNLNVGYVDWFQQHMIRQERDTGCPTPRWWPCRQHRGRGGALRDALYLGRASNDPGPDGRLLQGFGGGWSSLTRRTRPWCWGRRTGCLECWTRVTCLILPMRSLVLWPQGPESTCDRRSHLARSMENGAWPITHSSWSYIAGFTIVLASSSFDTRRATIRALSQSRLRMLGNEHCIRKKERRSKSISAF